MQGILKGCVILCTVYRDGAPVAPVPPSLENIVFSPSQLCQHRGAVWLNVRPFFPERKSTVGNDPALSRPSMAVRSVQPCCVTMWHRVWPVRQIWQESAAARACYCPHCLLPDRRVRGTSLSFSEVDFMACSWCSVHDLVDDLLLHIRELGSEMDKRGGSKTWLHC